MHTKPDGSGSREWDFHLHSLLLNGAFSPGVDPFYSDVRNHRDRRYRRFTFRFDGYRYDSIYRFQGETPYECHGNLLRWRGHLLPRTIPFAPIEQSEEEWGSERNWWFKDVPKLDPYYDLRLNPINACSNLRYRTGPLKDLRGCVFCQRCYELPREVESRRIAPPSAIFREIFEEHGRDVLAKVRKVIVITGEAPTEEDMVALLEEIFHGYLKPNGFRGTYSVVTTFIRSEGAIRRLAALENTFFEFPVECFTRREEILGSHKGIPLAEVADILTTARRYFKYIRTNYLVGLDDLESARDGFAFLCSRSLVDDVVSNIFVPFTERSMQFRRPESTAIEYLYEMREIMRSWGLAPKKTGTTKDAFSHFDKTDYGDELLDRVDRDR